MKNIIYLGITFLSFAGTVIGQDTIIQKDSTRIIAQVLEVGTTEIKYKKYQNILTGPVYDIERYKVHMIRYADGTQDIFSDPVPQLNTNPIAPDYYGYSSGNINNSSLKATGAYITLGGMVSPVNMYQGSAVNTYWRNLYNHEQGNGYMKLNNNNSLMYSFLMGGTLVLQKRNNWSYEFQFDMMDPHRGIHDSANYPDGTNGNFNMWYMSMNDAIQYTRGIDTGNNLQIGGELSLDVGLIFGGERDAFYSAGGAYADSNVNTDYDGAHIGWHIAAVGKYFVGKSKTLGFELLAGYRFMEGYNPESGISDGGINTPVSLSGPFVSLGMVLRLKAHYCINCGFDDYDY